ncbi:MULTISPECIES: DUF4190 domain-containing protein [Streptomyces]|uniref:DUF4190 domain-containing protein n=1 Tax=Streptomyces TaxID=1883 RepID=UPI0019C6B4E9|nr:MULTISPECIES: DUF4190 domain-containing protein [Streptomyces]GGT09415.1 hypothetical protein GCM10010286_38610 [Streptomyces toxytricini]
MSPRTGERIQAPTAEGSRQGGPRPYAARLRDADAMAVTAFVLGLVGLLVANLVLGPTAAVLGALALRKGTARPARARLGIALGVADVVVLACLVAADGTWSWSL